MARLVANGVAEADLEHVVGKLVEPLLVEVAAMPAKRIVGRLPRQPDEPLAVEPVALEHLLDGVGHASAYRLGV